MRIGKTATLRPLYIRGCPNCGGSVSSERLRYGLPCSNCIGESEAARLKEISDRNEKIIAVTEKLYESGKIKGYLYIGSVIEALQEFSKFFEKLVGNKMLDAQEAWALRIVQGESIAIVAPTGVGKTTLLAVYAVYRALKGAKVYYLLPTTNLVIQIVEKISRFREKAGGEIRIAFYHSNMRKQEKEREIKKIASGDFDVLVTTTSFLSRNWGILEDKKFNLILVDDVDAVLRNSKNIDRILVLAGFPRDVVEKAYTLVKLRMDAVFAKMTGHIKRYEQLLLKIKELEREIHLVIASIPIGQIIIASATGRVMGLKPKIFRELTGFEIGKVYDYTRNIVNFMHITGHGNGDEHLARETIELVKALNKPGLIFVSKVYGKQFAKKLVKKLKENGIKAALALSGTKIIEQFADGKVDVLVGIASYYGVIVRGIDLPNRVYYTLFVGVPATKISIEQALNSPYRILRLALELGIISENDDIVKRFSKLRYTDLMVLRIALQNKEKITGPLGDILEKLVKIRKTIINELKKTEKENNRLATSIGLIDLSTGSVIIPDPATYVQASGRASRLLNGAMTYGISIVIEEDEDLVRLLQQKLARYIENPDFQHLSLRDIEKYIRRAEESRRGKGRKIEVETAVIIVESPTKARTIANFFGKPVKRRIGDVIVYETTFYNEYTGKIYVASILASKGHIYDLTIDGEGVYGVHMNDSGIEPVYAPIKTCLDCGFQFASNAYECPRCGSVNIRSKEAVIDALRKIVLENGNVYIATDPDTEGEKIAYDIYLMVKPFAKNVKRIEMHEITLKEFLKAIAKPREVNRRLVDAQIVRRIEDRWIGFALSEKLWSAFGKRWLGAGRVQTPVLGWIIDRYAEWKKNLGYNVYAVLSKTPRVLLVVHVATQGEAQLLVKDLEDGLIVKTVEYEVRDAYPLPPYTTETLIYDASRYLKYPSNKTMRIAQELFENGLITYHRTDSTYVSSQGISAAEKYLSGRKELFNPRHWGSPGHHEAIRPTLPLDAQTLRKKIAYNEVRTYTRFTEAHYRLYDLIFRRFIASQMKPSKLKRARIELQTRNGRVFKLEVDVEVIETGHVEIAPYISIAKDFASLVPGDILTPLVVRAARGSTIKLYTHGDIVLLMREKGIGRPSTYAKTVTKLSEHGYVIESKYRKYLIPTKLGQTVYAYLRNNYYRYISEERTRTLYDKMDRIATGSVSAEEIIQELYHEVIEIMGKESQVAATGIIPSASAEDAVDSN